MKSLTLNANRLTISLTLLISIVLSCLAALPQTGSFTPIKADSMLLSQGLQRHERSFKTGLARLPSEYRGDYEKAYTKRWDNIKRKFDRREIYTEAAAAKYLQQLTDEIVKVNPFLQQQSFTCYFSRSAIPNASYIGEGIILFNMGLFSQLENESEAAFVLCHEIAHYILLHLEKDIGRYVRQINSTEVQNELKRIKQSKYERRDPLEKLVKGLSFDFSKHSRDHEMEADSMAVELMKSTRFNLTASLTALDLLDRIDQDSDDMALILKDLFNAPEYPFQNKWIQKEEGLLGGHTQLEKDKDADSLKTHPDCKKRMLLLQPMVIKYQEPLKPLFVIGETTFHTLQEQFRYEPIEYLYERSDYTGSLYHTLLLMRRKEGDSYLITHTGKLFNGIYAAQKNHTLNKFVELPSPYRKPNYNLVLQFTQNLYLSDIARINYYFLRRNETIAAVYPSFKDIYFQSKQNAQP